MDSHYFHYNMGGASSAAAFPQHPSSTTPNRHNHDDPLSFSNNHHASAQQQQQTFTTTTAAAPCTVSSILSYNQQRPFRSRIPSSSSQTPTLHQHPRSINNASVNGITPAAPDSVADTTPRCKRRTLVAFAIYSNVMGFAGLDDCHMMVCGQTTPYNVDIDKSSRSPTAKVGGKQHSSSGQHPSYQQNGSDPLTIPDVSLKSTKMTDFQLMQQKQVISLIRPGKGSNADPSTAVAPDVAAEDDEGDNNPSGGGIDSSFLACPSLQRAMWFQQVSEEMCEVLLRFAATLTNNTKQDGLGGIRSSKNGDDEAARRRTNDELLLQQEDPFDDDGELIVIFPNSALGNPSALLTAAIDMYTSRAPHELAGGISSQSNTTRTKPPANASSSSSAVEEATTTTTTRARDEGDNDDADTRTATITRVAVPRISIRMIPPSDFGIRKCSGCLEYLWPSMTASAWASKLDFSNTAMILALSAACTYVISSPSANRSFFGDGGSAAAEAFLVADVVESSSSGSSIRIDRGTFDSLQVFRMEPHPAAVHSIGSPKEGLSLHHIFHNKTHSFLGRSLIRQWLKTPTCSTDILQRRLDLVDLFVSIISGRHPSSFSSASSTHTLIPSLQKLLRTLQHPPDALVSRVQSERHSVHDYKAILHSATAIMDLCRLMSPFSTVSLTAIASPSSRPRSQSEAYEVAEQLGVTTYPVVDALLSSCQPDVVRELILRISSTIDLTTVSTSSSAVKDSGKGPKAQSENTKLQARTARATGMTKASILPGVNPTLDELRKCYETIDFDTFLSAAAQKEMESLPPYFNHWVVQVAFMPHLGYLAVVGETQVSNSRVEGMMASGSPNRASVGQTTTASIAPSNYADLAASLPHEWELLFVNGTQLYCKTAQTRELDQNVGDLHVAIRDLTASVLRELNDDIIRLSHCLTAIRHTAEIDATLALARVAVEEGWTRPHLFDNEGKGCGVALVNAYHPLLNRCTNTPVVPFSISLGLTPMSSAATSSPTTTTTTTASTAEPLPPVPRIAVLTGPHGSGKSVCQRAVGLIVLMAHVGSYVPAEYALIPLKVDHILAVDSSTPTSLFDMKGAATHGNATRRRVEGQQQGGYNNQHQYGGGHSFRDTLATEIGDQNLLLRSSFGKEVAAMCRALDVCTGRSLLLVDEFGKGTLAADGVALLAAVIADLHDRPYDQQRPMAMFSTHYTEIFEKNLVSAEAVMWLHMKVAIIEQENSNSSRSRSGASLSMPYTGPRMHSTQHQFHNNRPSVNGGTHLRGPSFFMPSSAGGSPAQTLNSFLSPARPLSLSPSNTAGRFRVTSPPHSYGGGTATSQLPGQNIFAHTPRHPNQFTPLQQQQQQQTAFSGSAAPSWPTFPGITPRGSTHRRPPTPMSDATSAATATSRAYVSLNNNNGRGADEGGGGSEVVLEVLPLFQLEECALGTMVKSALETARMVGVPPVILDRAHSVLKILVSESLSASAALQPISTGIVDPTVGEVVVGETNIGGPESVVDEVANVQEGALPYQPTIDNQMYDVVSNTTHHEEAVVNQQQHYEYQQGDVEEQQQLQQYAPNNTQDGIDGQASHHSSPPQTPCSSSGVPGEEGERDGHSNDDGDMILRTPSPYPLDMPEEDYSPP